MTADEVVITREQQAELDPLLNAAWPLDVLGGVPAVADAIMAGYKLGRQHGQGPPVPQVTISVKMEVGGAWVAPEVIADTAERLADELAGQLRAEAAGIRDGGPGR